MKTAIFRIPYTEHIIFPKNSKLNSSIEFLLEKKFWRKKKKERNFYVFQLAQ